ncbi:peptidase inhibitor R3HDML [Crotalus adamanteus]|uniref:Peptidase inhibitor R3HDML n=1 Tax=Crotalus adamanteus TaxID=8729 RepID=A0AAW1BRM5_CROAD
MSTLLGYHNQVRAQVSPPAANMEYMPLYSDGVGFQQQNWLCCPHLYQHKCVGQHMAASSLLSVQLCHQGQLDRRSTLQNGKTLFSLPT